jgi:hypothetical protein
MGMEVEVTVVAVPVAIAVRIRVAGRRQGRRTEREDAGESEHCSTSEHGLSLWSYGFVHPHIGREAVALRSSR